MALRNTFTKLDGSINRRVVVTGICARLTWINFGKAGTIDNVDLMCFTCAAGTAPTSYIGRIDWPTIYGKDGKAIPYNTAFMIALVPAIVNMVLVETFDDPELPGSGPTDAPNFRLASGRM